MSATASLVLVGTVWLDAYSHKRAKCKEEHRTCVHGRSSRKVTILGIEPDGRYLVFDPVANRRTRVKPSTLASGFLPMHLLK